MPEKLREVCVVVSKGTKFTADFSNLDLSKQINLEMALNAVDQGYEVTTLNLTDTNLTPSQITNDLLTWFKSNATVN